MTALRKSPPDLDSPTSVMGQLQRGHGAIARKILSHGVPGARALVIECIRTDPRWDGQLDQRADYYAELTPAVGIDAEDLLALVEADEAAATEHELGPCLALQVLFVLCAHDDDALAAVRRYVASGRYWSSAVDALVEDWRSGAVSPNWRERADGTIQALTSRWPDPERLRSVLSDGADARRTPWREWAVEHPEIGKALEPQTPRARERREPRERLRGRPTEDLLALDESYLPFVAQRLRTRTTANDIDAMRRVVADPGATMYAAAVLGLAVQGHAEVLPAIETLTEQTPRRAGRLLFAALAALPYDTTRPLALAWLDSEDFYRRRAAARAVSEAATPEDVSIVRRVLSIELDRGERADQYLVCDYAIALGRHPNLGPYPELDRAFHEMPYSYGRRFVVEALMNTNPEFLRTNAIDCLWDAEPEVRDAAAAAVDRSEPEAATRIRAIATEPC